MGFRAFALLLVFLFSLSAWGADPMPEVKVSQPGEGFVVEMSLDVPVPVRTAWDVLVDFDHMAGFVNNLVSSRIAGKDGNALVVHQDGVARFGLLSFNFHTEREIRLEPYTRIVSRTVRGNVKQGSSVMQLLPQGAGTRLLYRAEFIPDSFFARFFGTSFIQHEVTEQFQLMAKEMLRRNGALGAQLRAD